MLDIKVCPFCEREYQRTWQKPGAFRKQKFCSKKCSLTSRNKSPEYRKMLRDKFLGRPVTWKQKISESHKKLISHSGRYKKGHTTSPEVRAKIGRANGPLALGRRHRPESIEKCRQGKLGEKNPNWKGGTTPLNKKIRGGLEYRNWRDAVFKRDNYTCQECGIRSGQGRAVVLNADHIRPFAFFPELRFELSNGRTLCHSCHKKTDTFGLKLVWSMRKNCKML